LRCPSAKAVTEGKIPTGLLPQISADSALRFAHAALAFGPARLLLVNVRVLHPKRCEGAI